MESVYLIIEYPLPEEAGLSNVCLYAIATNPEQANQLLEAANNDSSVGSGRFQIQEERVNTRLATLLF